MYSAESLKLCALCQHSRVDSVEICVFQAMALLGTYISKYKSRFPLCIFPQLLVERKIGSCSYGSCFVKAAATFLSHKRVALAACDGYIRKKRW